jgi:hypothetical protein
MFWSATPNFGQPYYLWSATLVMAGQLVTADHQRRRVVMFLETEAFMWCDKIKSSTERLTLNSNSIEHNLGLDWHFEVWKRRFIEGDNEFVFSIFWERVLNLSIPIQSHERRKRRYRCILEWFYRSVFLAHALPIEQSSEREWVNRRKAVLFQLEWEISESFSLFWFQFCFVSISE